MHEKLLQWFDERGWERFDYQQRTWAAYLDGRSGLVHAPTGMGKTYAAWGGPIIEWLRETGGREPGNGRHNEQSDPSTKALEQSRKGRAAARDLAPPLRVLWITPLRALASDIVEALKRPVADLGLGWTVEKRTGDVSSSIKSRQRKRLPTALVTTPESLSVLLSYPDAAAKLASLRAVVVDEWHELMSTKRGVQMELALARLRRFAPELRTWGLSATIGNLEQARDVLLGAHAGKGELITAPAAKVIEVETLEPDRIERFPWYGHLGVQLVEPLADAIERAASTLVFTNTRSQAELWFEKLMRALPALVGRIALHHGSIDRKLRERVEAMLGAGELKAVVCTSSLDLGVDFTPVDQVVQIGSPKGIARLMQRAGRSGHQPGATSRVICVPTHAFELVEFAAARRAMGRRQIEARPPLRLAVDVLAQHLVTVGLGGGFTVDAMLAEVRSTHAFAELADEQWGWVMDFVTRGGSALEAYPQYRKLVPDEAGVYRVTDRRIARLHRMAIGTIVSDAAMTVKYNSGKTLGTIEESFIARLSPGDRFLFSGRRLELVRVRGMTAYVKRVGQVRGAVPRWQGARFPLSTLLADDVLELLREAGEGRCTETAMRTVGPLLALQQEWSTLPTPGMLLIEQVNSREGHHTFLFPFAGRLVHEGLGALAAYRLSQRQPRSLTVTSNDYGIELLSREPFDDDPALWRELLSHEHLVEDLLQCLNATQMARRYFREIARIAGLIFPGYPGEQRSSRQLQASSDLFYDVFLDYEPRNLLLDQARREVLEQQLELQRLRAAIDRVRSWPIRVVATDRITPLAFPLSADRLRTQMVSSEKWHERVAKMVERLERAAGEAAAAPQ